MNIKRYLEIARISEESTCTNEFNKDQIGFIEKLYNNLQISNYNNIALYGTGDHTRKIIEFLKNKNYNIEKIKCLISNENIGADFYGLKVLAIDKAEELYNLDAIIISSYKFEDVIYERINKEINENTKLIKIYDCIIADAEERIYLSTDIKDNEVGKYGSVYFEHLNRYYFALGYARNSNVLDIACGSGYGSDIMAFSAKNVIGVDIDNTAIEYAKNHYNKNNLQFVNESIEQFTADSKVDLITSFETIEHISDENSYFEMIKRNLKDEGILIVSTPVSDFNGMSRTNKYHINQYTVERFNHKLKDTFNEVIFYRQDEENKGAISVDDGNMINSISEMTYMIAVCYGIKK